MKELFRYVYRNKFVSILLKLLIGIFLIGVVSGLGIYILDELFSFSYDNIIARGLFRALLHVLYFLAYSFYIALWLLIITVIFRIVRYKVIIKPCGGVAEHRILDME